MARPTCSLVFLFTMILAVSVSYIPSVYGQRTLSEAEALIKFKDQLKDPNNVLESWDLQLIDPCTWFRITCNQDNKVISVSLIGSNLSGNLVPELGRLSSLQRLMLGKNNFVGTIPAEIGDLMNLEALDLSNNKLTGPLHPNIGKLPKLRIADLSSNNRLCWNFWPTPVYNGSYNVCWA